MKTSTAGESSALLTMALQLSALKPPFLLPRVQKLSKGEERNALCLPGLAPEPTQSCWLTDITFPRILPSSCKSSIGAAVLPMRLGAFPPSDKCASHPALRAGYLWAELPEGLTLNSVAYANARNEFAPCFLSEASSIHHECWTTYGARYTLFRWQPLYDTVSKIK